MKIKLLPYRIFFILMLVSLAGCQGRPAIQNPDLDHYHYGKFVNLKFYPNLPIQFFRNFTFHLD